jgi:hypothetical protein
MDEDELNYLDDIKAQPDFLDEAPHVPSNKVSFLTCLICSTISWLILAFSYPHNPKRRGPPYDARKQQSLAPYTMLLQRYLPATLDTTLDCDGPCHPFDVCAHHFTGTWRRSFIIVKD